MNTKLIASCIAATWLVTGCGGGSGSDPISSGAPNALSDNVVSPASVNISASFPQSAQAAAIDDNAQAITVAFYPSEAGSIEEAREIVELSAKCLQESTTYNDWSCLPEDGPSLGEPALLTAGAPSVSLDLVPGKYRVEAFQFDTSTPNFDTPPMSATSSFVTLTAGEHSLELNLVHATWTAQTAITPQLLGNVLQDDANNDIDMNPNVDGTQTLADLLEMTDQPIIGMHMVGMSTFISETESLFDNPSSSATAAYDEFPVNPENDPEESAREIMEYWLKDAIHIPVLRQSTADSSETVVWWWDDPTMGDYCNVVNTQTQDGGEICAERFAGPALLLQGYQPTAGNSNQFDLGEVWAEYEEWSPEGSGLLIEGGMTAVPFLFADPTVTSDNGTVTLDWGDGQVFAHVHQQSLETLSGFEDAVFLDFESESGSTSFADDANRLDQVTAPTITGGTTITGTFVEFLIQFDEQQVGATVPTVPDNITPDMLSMDPIGSIMGTQAAAAAGLTAQPSATANGDNCSALTENFAGVFTKFIWDDTTSSWLGGTWNYSYFLSDENFDGVNDTINGDDLNGDGTIDQFEVGVYENWTCIWDEINQTEVCDDLDNEANDTDQRIETVPTGWNETGTGEYCLHPFTMTASQLSFSFSDLLSAPDVTVQN